jgi:iron complex outermembrane receptor protein
MSKRKNLRKLAALPALVILAGGPALAQEVADDGQAVTQEEAEEGAAIVVTAQKRTQNIQDVPISITALGANDLAQRGTLDTDTLSAAVPSLQISNLGAQGIAIFTIRGVSQNDFSDQNEAPNAIYVDGAYRSFIGAAGFTMFDVDRVEVLRGPQGTLYGRNATGGLVHVINRQPTRTFEAYAEVEGGERNLIEARGAVSGPLSQDIQARLSLATKHNDGYVRNIATGERQGGANNWSGRLQLRVAPEESDSSLLVSGHYSKDDVTGATIYDNKRAIIDFSDPGRRTINPTSNAQHLAFCQALFDANTPVPLAITPTSNCAGWQDPAPDNPYVSEFDNPGFSRREIYGATVTGNFALSDAVDLVTISDYLRLDRSIGVDTDGTGFRMFNFFSDAKSSQLSQEVRLTGKSGGVDCGLRASIICGSTTASAPASTRYRTRTRSRSPIPTHCSRSRPITPSGKRPNPMPFSARPKCRSATSFR